MDGEKAAGTDAAQAADATAEGEQAAATGDAPKKTDEGDSDAKK